MSSLNREIKGVKILTAKEIENNPSYDFLKGEHLDKNCLWLSPNQSFSPLTDIEFSFYLLTHFILIPFIYLGYQNSVLYGSAGIVLLILLIVFTIKRYQKIRKQYLRQKLDKNEHKKGMLFDSKFLFFNEGKNKIYQIELDVLQHLQFYNTDDEKRFEWVAEGKVLIEGNLNDYQNNWNEIIPLLQIHNIKLLNYEDD